MTDQSADLCVSRIYPFTLATAICQSCLCWFPYAPAYRFADDEVPPGELMRRLIWDMSQRIDARFGKGNQP